MRCEIARTHTQGYNFFLFFFPVLMPNWTSTIIQGLPRWLLVVKNLPANAGDTRDAGSIPGSGRSPGGGHGNPLQCSGLENPMNRGAWQAMVHGVTKNWTQLKWFSTHTPLFRTLLVSHLSAVKASSCLKHPYIFMDFLWVLHHVPSLDLPISVPISLNLFKYLN